MAATGTSPLDTPIDGLLATPTSRLPYQHNVLLRSYVLQRPQGNLLVYNSPGLTEAADAIRALGEPARLLVNHGHESMHGQPALDAPVWVHTRDRAEIATSLEVAGTFDGCEQIDDDLEVIPTPGHTPGTTEGGPSVDLVPDRAEVRARIDAII
jgi:glyoxylase-like metal-dependent hydrolase (beta-lactamase superfamily II)